MNQIPILDERSEFLSRCTRCAQCRFVTSPKSQRHASACPSIDYGQHHAYSGGGQLIMAHALWEGRIDCSSEMLSAVSSCTMCGHCDTICKVNFAETVEPLDSLYALRAKVVELGHSPEPHRQLIENLRLHGNVAGRPRSERDQWALGLFATRSPPQADVLFHIGGTLAYDKSHRQALRTVYETLQHSGISLAHLGAAEGPSGSLAFDLGYVDDARKFAQTLTHEARLVGAQTLVTFSASALSAFRSIYPRLGLSFGSMRVLHITEYLLELAEAGLIAFARPPMLRDQHVAYHDPCKLGRLSEPWRPRELELDVHMGGILASREPSALRFGNGGCYEPPRALLRRMKLHVLELERHHAASYCCGAGGGVATAVPEAAALAASKRLAEVADSPSNILVSGCSSCSRHLGQHVQGSMQVVDLLSLIAQSIRPATPATVRTPRTVR